jgi:integrase
MPNIEPRGINTWRLVVEAGNTPDGKRRRERETLTVTDPDILRSKRKLDSYLQEQWLIFKQKVETGQYIKPGRMTFNQFIPIWMKNHAEQNLGGYTLRNYYAAIDKQLKPEFGHMEIGTIKTIHIVNYFAKLRSPEGRKDGKDKPLATNTLLNRYTVLKSVFDCAKAWKFIADNPMEGVQRPKAGKKEKREMRQRKKSYTPVEAREAILLLLEQQEHWRWYFIGVMLGGFRRGEMLGVEWSSVLFGKGGIFIDKQITFDFAGNTVEGEVKAITSEGFVPMPRFYMQALEQYKTSWMQQRKDLGYVPPEEGGNAGARWKGGEKQFLFHNGFGEMLYPDAPTRYWNRLLNKNEIPRIRLHDLRHTTAMLLREERADLKAIQERLRHARLETTTNIYMDESEVINRETADLLEKYNPFGEQHLGPDWGRGTILQ